MTCSPVVWGYCRCHGTLDIAEVDAGMLVGTYIHYTAAVDAAVRSTHDGVDVEIEDFQPIQNEIAGRFEVAGDAAAEDDKLARGLALASPQLVDSLQRRGRGWW